MAVEIVKMHTVNLPTLRLIGKQCNCEIHDFVADWGEWIKYNVLHKPDKDLKKINDLDIIKDEKITLKKKG